MATVGSLGQDLYNIAAGLKLGGKESYPGKLAATSPMTPSSDFESKPAFYEVLRGLHDGSRVQVSASTGTAKEM